MDARLATVEPARSRDVAARVSLLRQRTGQPADAPAGELRWSLGLLMILAGAWTFEGLAFFLSSLFEGSDEPWISAAIWRSTSTILWFAFSPLIFFLTKAFPVAGAHAARNIAVHVLAALGLATAYLAIFLPANAWLNPNFSHQMGTLARRCRPRRRTES
jgi:hypothetical protein